MRFKNFSFLCIAFLSILSCKKSGNSDNQPEPKKEVDIYIAGLTMQGKAAYWKNGAINLLVSNDEQSSKATDIAVQGSDVYLSGYRYVNDLKQACYWKNGVRYELEDNNFDSEATAIALKGSDVYVIGSVYNAVLNKTIYICWKNGAKTNLISDISNRWYASDIAVKGDDIYIVGGASESNKQQAVVCKNGTLTLLPFLTTGAIYSTATALTIVDNNIYISGYENSGTPESTALYWKNGAAIQVAKPALAYDVTVVNNDVYVAGEKLMLLGTYPIGSYATFWKNGAESFVYRNYYSDLQNIVVNQGDIYAIGRAESLNVFYKNGVKQNFSNVPAFPIKMSIVSK